MGSKKPSHCPTIDLLPQGWRVEALQDFCSKIGTGATPRGGQGVYLASRENYALIRSQNVYDRSFSHDGLAFISDEDAQALSGAEVNANDVLLNITGDGVTFGRSCLAPTDVLPACVNQHVSIVRPVPSECDSGYLLSVLTHPASKGYIESFNSGGSRRAITKGHIESFRIPLPPLPEQKAITRILGALDDKIELNRQMNATLEAMAQALFKHWFVDFAHSPDSIAVRADSKWVHSVLGKIPQDWEVSTIGEEADLVGGATPSTKNPDYWADEGFPWVTPKDFSGLRSKVLIQSSRYVTRAGLASISSGLLPLNTVLMSSRAPVGYLALTQIETAINQGFIAMVCERRLPPEYVLLWADSIMDQIKQAASGTTFAEISKRTFRLFPILVPAPDILRRFTAVVRPLFERVTLNERESLTLAATRDSLLPQLLSGQIRVEG